MRLELPGRGEVSRPVPSISDILVGATISFVHTIYGLKPVFFQSAAELQLWMQEHHENADEVWIGFYKKHSRRPGITYAEAVDEALCCGWIDGVRHSVDEKAYKIRFTPRKPKSQWSSVNIRRMQTLIEAGRVRPAGLGSFEGAKNQPRTYSYEQRNEAKLSPADQRRFRAERSAWSFFQAQPPWYRRTSTFWVVSAKKAETRRKRLAILIEDSAKGKTIAPLTRKSAIRKG